MQNSSTGHRGIAIDTLIGQICRATPGEARELSMLLTAAERAEVALFCYGRSHLREQGRSIAASCTPESLGKAGGAAGHALALQIDAKGDTWGAGAHPERKRVSLAGR